ncbi:DUF3626 domain-containing protein [Paenibacillus ginsengarvi]|uniref:DUF3626 domain-containing protein n=1 Tax=Paenibacillus ginsengarvi TaxID=400777 RepID=UPI001F00D11E|nr:DUF3626 domain-containing protein [Paenibacillus ginsengarvi]
MNEGSYGRGGASGSERCEAGTLPGSLTPAQAAALGCVRAAALAASESACAKAGAIMQRADAEESAFGVLVRNMIAHARVTLNFHPDRISSAGYSVAEGLLREGVYRSQFETGVTNGSRTAYPGGSRDGWEQSLFGGAYQAPGVRSVERPKYGALNVMNYEDGGAPRFGSCYFRLRRSVTDRCTFTFGDSHTGPEPIGTADAFEPLAAALLEACETNQAALGTSGVNIVSLVRLLGRREPDGRGAGIGRALDDYIEAQVHGAIDLSADVEALVADPSFRGTAVGRVLEALSTKYAFELAWHPGFRLTVVSVPDDFRGPAMPPFALRIDREFGSASGWLDAHVLGKAAVSLHESPGSWQDWGTPDETFQHIKQLWHVLVRYGQPFES